MELPETIARARIPEEGADGDRPYRRFFTVVFHTDGSGGKPLVFNAKYAKEGELYAAPGTLLQAKKTGGYIGHVYEWNSDMADKGKILASIRIENQFGQRFYVVDIYERSFLSEVMKRWGNENIEMIRKKPEEKKLPELVRR